LVAMTIFLTPSGGTLKAKLWSDEDKTECNANIWYL
jgi:hypothetical protein